MASQDFRSDSAPADPRPRRSHFRRHLSLLSQGATDLFDCTQCGVDIANKVVKVDTPRCSAKQLEEESDESDSSPQKSPTIVKVFPSPITQPPLSPSDLKAKFFQSNITIPYHQSQAALTPPYSNSPLRGAVGINSDIGSPSHAEKGGLSAGIRSSRRSDRLSRNPVASETSHLSMPCLHQVKIADSQPNLQSAISAQYKKALGKW